MIDFELYQKQQSEKGYLSPYIVQLLYKEDSQLEKDRLMEALRKNCGSIEPMEEQAGIMAFAHSDKLMRVQEGLIPVQSIFSSSEAVDKPLDTFAPSLTQTWDWQDAEEAVSKVKAIISVTDSFTDGLTRKARLKLSHDVILSALEVSEPVAIHWLPSQRIVNPVRYKEDLSQGGQLFSSAVNVRMFKVENSNERVMDTMGLTALGLPDLQCNFVNADPGRIGLYLYELAEYIFERGDVFRDGDTIDGIERQHKWPIRKENSYVPPSRRVINVMPGEFSPSATSQSS